MRLDMLLAGLEQTPRASRSGPHSELNLEQTEITSLAYDSRQIRPGGLFLAVPGEHTDGRRFLADAAQRGALAALGPAGVGETALPYIEVADIRAALADLAFTFYCQPDQQHWTIVKSGPKCATTTTN